MTDEKTEYYVCPGYYYPIWSIRGDVAKNVESDTDMDELTAEEFHKYFPGARKMKENSLEAALRRLEMIRSQEEEE